MAVITLGSTIPRFSPYKIDAGLKWAQNKKASFWNDSFSLVLVFPFHHL
jgi:hypothetical protein